MGEELKKENKIRMVKMTEADFNLMVGELMNLPAGSVGNLLFRWLPTKTTIFEEMVNESKVEELPNNVLPFKKPEEIKEEKKEE